MEGRAHTKMSAAGQGRTAWRSLVWPKNRRHQHVRSGVMSEGHARRPEEGWIGEDNAGYWSGPNRRANPSRTGIACSSREQSGHPEHQTALVHAVFGEPPSSISWLPRPVCLSAWQAVHGRLFWAHSCLGVCPHMAHIPPTHSNSEGDHETRWDCDPRKETAAGDAGPVGQVTEVRRAGEAPAVNPSPCLH